MARKSFALNVDPHIAEIGDVELAFHPEVMGDEYLDAYGRLQETYRELGIGANGDLSGLTVDQLRAATGAVGAFLEELMLPESAATFGEMRLPSRVLMELFEWSLEVYGGGGRPPTSSSGSSTPSRKAGTTGTGTSRSKGSPRTRGR